MSLSLLFCTVSKEALVYVVSRSLMSVNDHVIIKVNKSVFQMGCFELVFYHSFLVLLLLQYSIKHIHSQHKQHDFAKFESLNDKAFYPAQFFHADLKFINFSNYLSW